MVSLLFFFFCYVNYQREIVYKQTSLFFFDCFSNVYCCFIFTWWFKLHEWHQSLNRISLLSVMQFIFSLNWSSETIILFYCMWGEIRKRRNTLRTRIKLTKILRIKDISTDVHKTFNFPLTIGCIHYLGLGRIYPLRKPFKVVTRTSICSFTHIV